MQRHSARPTQVFSPGFHDPGRRWWLWFATVLTLVGGCDRRELEPHYLGQVVPLSGSQRLRGQEAMRGAELAVEEANAEKDGLIVGKKIAVLHADSAGDSKAAAAQAMRLATVNRVVAFIGGTSRSEAMQIGPTAREYGLLAINAAGVTAPAPHVVFGIGLSELERARTIDRFLIESSKATAVSIISDGTKSRENQLADELGRLSRARSVTVNHTQIFKESDLSASGSSLREFKGTIIVVAPASMYLQLRQMLDPRAPDQQFVFAGDESERAEIAAVDGTYFVSAYAIVDTPEFKSFSEKHRKKYASEPTPEAAANYDSAHFLLAGAREAKTFSAKELREKLNGMKGFAGLMGPLTPGPDYLVRGPSFVIQITNGHEEVRKRYDPAPKEK